MATPEQLKQFREKALESPLIGKRGKGKATLRKEEMESYFIQEILKHWIQLVRAEIKGGLKDQRAREFLISHVLGKPKERKDVLIQESSLSDEMVRMGIEEELRDQIEKEIKEKYGIKE